MYCIYNSMTYNFVVLFVTIFHPASWGVWPGMGSTPGWGAQYPWCSCIAERVPQRLAWPTADKGTVHSLHQHNVWGAQATNLLYKHTQELTSLAVIGMNSWVNLYQIYLKLTSSGGLFFFFAVLDYSDQASAIQLLIFLLPPCNSDTLQCLLCLLSTVAKHAEDKLDNNGQEVKKQQICLYSSVYKTGASNICCFVAYNKIRFTLQYMYTLAQDNNKNELFYKFNVIMINPNSTWKAVGQMCVSPTASNLKNVLCQSTVTLRMIIYCAYSDSQHWAYSANITLHHNKHTNIVHLHLSNWS